MIENKILIIDDLVENLKTIVSIFETYRPNYTLFQTNNALSALKILDNIRPDLIITDWDMPGMNGIELIKTLKQHQTFCEIPIIMATGVNLSSDDLQTALNAGATDYIRKPIDPVELVARTHSVLMISQYHKQMLAVKDEELTESALYLVKSNESIIDFNKKLDQLAEMIEPQNTRARLFLKQIINQQNEQMQEDSWLRFNLSFNKVHGNFNRDLVLKFPDLTATDLKLCAFIHLGMNNKDIASVLNQSADSIKVSRSRLRKKLGIDQSQNLETFLAGI